MNCVRMFVMLGWAGLFPALSGCDAPAPPPRIDHQLQDTEDPEEQLLLLQEAQQRFGKEEAVNSEAPEMPVNPFKNLPVNQSGKAIDPESSPDKEKKR